jgi:UTP--glucose-1-phosphate uridylyltransferase
LATHPVLALPLIGERFDCGSRHGFIKATIEYAMDHDDMRDDILDHMQLLLAREGRL